MNDYVIMEYSFENKKYTSIGVAEGFDSKEAKKNFIEKTGWEQKDGVFLFAKPPLCR